MPRHHTLSVQWHAGGPAGAAVRNTEWTGDGGPTSQYRTIKWKQNKTFEVSLVNCTIRLETGRGPTLIHGGPTLQYRTIKWKQNKTFEVSLVRKKLGKITYLGGIDFSGGYCLIFS